VGIYHHDAYAYLYNCTQRSRSIFKALTYSQMTYSWMTCAHNLFITDLVPCSLCSFCSFFLAYRYMSWFCDPKERGSYWNNASVSPTWTAAPISMTCSQVLPISTQTTSAIVPQVSTSTTNE
jgi:hypothetical protein